MAQYGLECPLCNQPCAGTAYADSDLGSCQCNGCGRFHITSMALSQLQQMPDLDRRRIAACIRERQIHRMSEPVLVGDSEDFTDSRLESCSIHYLLDAVFPNRIQDRFDRILMNLCEMTSYPGEEVVLGIPDGLPILFAESLPSARFIVEQLKDAQLIACRWPATALGQPVRSVTLMVKATGIQRAQELEHPSSRAKSLQAFVAMYFHESTEAAYNQGMIPAIMDCGFRPVRIDLKETVNKICDEIIAEIRRSRFLVADFTGQRGGVYFEAGFALGLGIPVIWTCQRDHITDLHFDTRQYSHIVWEDPQDLRYKLSKRIAAIIIPATAHPR